MHAIDALVSTAIRLEFDAVLSLLENPVEIEGPQRSQYVKGTLRYDDLHIEIAVAEAGVGNSNASIALERALGFFETDLAVFVGVAGGLKDVVVGDVVIATKVSGYEAGRDEDEFLQRGDSFPCSYNLLTTASGVGKRSKLQSWRGETSVQGTALHFGPVVSGEKVVASIRGYAYEQIRKSFSDALVVDMESEGFMRAAFSRHQAPEAIVVRGVSDVCADKTVSDAGGSQPRAAREAAIVALNLVRLELAKRRERPLPEQPAVLDLCIHLYPHGPVEQNIWVRAGGDSSRLNQRQAGRDMWHEALSLLFKGGGGSGITLRRLFATMREDFDDQRLAPWGK